MTYLASAWKLWKLQFLAERRAWFWRVLFAVIALLTLVAVPLISPRWGLVFGPVAGMGLLWSCIAPAEKEYRAFGMNRRRAMTHAALTVVPLTIFVSIVVLLTSAFTAGPPIFGWFGVLSSCLVGMALINAARPDREKSVDVSSGASRFAGGNNFAWRALWRPMLVWALGAGAVGGVISFIDFGIDWLPTHGIAHFVFGIWAGMHLATTATAWSASGLSRRNWIRHLIPAGIAGAVLLNAAMTAVFAAIRTSVPGNAGALEVAQVTGVNVSATIIVAAIALTAGTAGSGAQFWALLLNMLTWGAYREALSGDMSVATYRVMALVVGGILLLFTAINLYTLLTDRRSMVAQDHLGKDRSS